MMDIPYLIRIGCISFVLDTKGTHPGTNRGIKKMCYKFMLEENHKRKLPLYLSRKD